MSAHLGILAYGSLIDDPGEEIASATADTLHHGIMTPFPVEFARSSRTRAGAPTLVPVTTGGARVPARVFVLRGDVSDQQARDMLWRRETGGKGDAPAFFIPSNPGRDEVIIDSIVNFHAIRTVLYTRIAPNITPLTAQRLAELASESTRCAEVAGKGRDGIGYMIAALSNGVRTKLSGAYEGEVLRRTGAATLTEALARTLRRVDRIPG